MLLGEKPAWSVNSIHGVPKKPQTIEKDLLLEFQWPSTDQVKPTSA